jgi:DNA repair protein RecO (recombination protein O)
LAQEKTEAVVLRGVDFSNSSRIVTFLTPNRGKLACLARGALRKGSISGPLLDTMNRLEIVYYWKEGRNVQQLGELSLLDNYSLMKNRLECSTHAAFPLEIALKVVHEGEPAEEPYAILVRGFEKMQVNIDAPRLEACRLAMQLLAVTGYAPELECCITCGGTLSQAPGFSYAGGVTCRNCRFDRMLSSDAYNVLCVWQQQMDEVRDTEVLPEIGDIVNPVVQMELFSILSCYAAYQLDTTFRSVKVIKEMFP